MRLYIRRGGALLLVSCLLSSGLSYATPPALPKFPPLVFNPPKPQRVVLPNGLILFLLEDHELPLIKISALVRTGSQYEPADKVGLGDMFGPAMTQGGSQKFSPEDILRRLDVTGGSLSFSMDTEQAGAGLACRAADFDKLLPIFADLLRNPMFRNDFVKLEKEKAQEALRRMNDDPTDIARREFRHVVYGQTHPYGRTPTPLTVDKIRRKDLLEMHQRYFKPNTTMMAVSGDFQSAEMQQKITAALADWTRAEVSYPKIPPVAATKESALFYVQRPIDQTQIRIGHTGFARHDPDHYAWEVFNELWGGSATSELFRTVRTQKGLAYQVASVFTERTDLGLIVAVCQTRGSEAPEAVKTILDINRRVQKTPFPEEDLRSAKEAIRNRFVENFTSSSQIAEQVMALEYNGYPKDYLETYPDKIAALTQADLRRAAEKHLHPDQSVILVVGDLSTFNKPLSTLGRPQEIRLPDYRLESLQP